MRKITSAICLAFESRNKLAMGNSMTDGETLFLHANAIARHGAEGLEVTTAGWDTNTTRERLNGLDGVSAYRRKGELILNGRKWHGDWVNVLKWGTGDIK